MRTTSNPAFRNLPGGQNGGYATFDRQAGMMGGTAAYTDRAGVGYGRADAAARPITVDDIVTKTAITAGAAIVAGGLTVWSGLYALALPAFIVGFVVSLVIIFKQSSNPALVMTYSIAEGIALGGISGLINQAYPGIAFQALIGTVGVFIGMLVVYKTGAVRVTPRFVKIVFASTLGVFGLMIVNAIAGIFTSGGLGLRDPQTNMGLAVIFSLVCIVIAAANLIIDFDMIEQSVRRGTDEKFGWYLSWGILITLVWLYLEILRLLSYLNGGRNN